MVNVHQKAFRMVSALLLSAMVIVSGCSSKSEEGQSQSQTQGTDATTEKTTEQQTPESEKSETEEFVTISWYIRKPIDNMKDQEAVEAAVNETFKKQLNAELKFNFIDVASWEEKMKVMAAAGEPHDLVFTAGWTNRFDLNVQKGAFLPLDELLEKYGQDIVAKVDPRAWDAVRHEGKIMAIPGQVPYSMPSAFVFRRDLADKYKLDHKSIKTMKDLEPYLETIKKNEPGVTPLLVTGNAPSPGLYSMDYTSIIGGIVYDEKNGTLTLEIDAPENLTNLRLTNEYYKNGYIAKDAAIKTDYMAEAKSGNYAVMRDAGGYTEDGSKSTGMYGFPTYEALFDYPLIQTRSMISAATAISKTSKNPERAMMMLNLIWKDKTLSNTLAYGIKDVNYTVTAGEGTDNPTVLAKSGAEQTWAIWHNWVGPLWDQWDSNWNSTKDLELMRHNNETAETSDLLGFIFNPDPVKSEVTQVQAVLAEINPVLYTGSMSDFDQYMAEAKQKLKNAGIDALMAEVQKQIDEWKAKQP